jgi:hypothetical protein
MQWNGTQCCTDSFPVTCAAGNSTACVGAGLHWTGTKCCVDGAEQCVDGDSADCTFGGWTGSLCCVAFPAGACTSGETTQAQCYNSNGHWTGAVCCIQ